MPYGQQVVWAKAMNNVKCLSISYSVINRLFGNISEVLRLSTIRAFLEPLAFFQMLTEKQQMKIAGQFQEEKVRKGDIVVSKDADPQLVVVIEGEVSVLSETPDPACLIELKNSGEDFANVLASRPVMEPEMEPDTQSNGRSSQAGDLGGKSKGEVQKLLRGDTHGEATFKEES